MGLSSILVDFGSVTVENGGSARHGGDDDRDAIELAAFERGYKSGWEDALRGADDDNKRLSAAFEQTLQDLSFTYHEAYGHALRGMEPLLKELSARILPEILQETFGAHLVESILRQVSGKASPSVTIAVAPEKVEAMDRLLGGSLPFSVEVTARADFRADQAEIALDESIERVDLSDLLHDLRQAVAHLFETPAMRAANE